MKNSAIKALFAAQHNVPVENVSVESIGSVGNQFEFNVYVDLGDKAEQYTFVCSAELKRTI